MELLNENLFVLLVIFGIVFAIFKARSIYINSNDLDNYNSSSNNEYSNFNENSFTDSSSDTSSDSSSSSD